MVRRCVAYGCSHENNNLYGWPSDPVYATKWDSFVKVKRLNWRSHSTSSQLCFAHFTTDQFANKMQYDAGYCKKLLLKPDAVPTLHTAPSTASQVFSPGRSAYEKRERQRVIKGILSSVTEDVNNENINPMVPMSDDEESTTEIWHDVATQTDRELHSQGIQTMKMKPTYIYKYRYKYHRPAKKIRRSRGIQFSPVTRDIGTSMKKRKGRPLGSYSKTRILDWSSRESDDEQDDDYMPNSSSDETDSEPEVEPIKFNEMIDESNIPYREQTKFVVTQTALLQLFEKCRVCQDNNIVQKRIEESHLFVKTKCPSCNHGTEWENCPKIRGMSVISILLSSVIILTGSLQSKVLRLFSFMGICCMSSRTFFRHQSKYIHRAVASVWATKQQNLLNEREHTELIVGGDGRCDSAGHSAKYGIYTIIDIPANKILNMELIQSTETESSNKMELEGLKRCQKKMKNFKIEALVTDMHLQIAKWVRESWKIPHYYDCWHVVKCK